MGDFIMTMSSDDERPAKPAPSTSAAPAKKPKPSSTKQSRKQQLEAAKRAKKQKRKTVDDASDLEPDSEPPVNSDDEGGPGGMTADFHFDGLGGGFVGDRRNNVWDAGIDYVTKKHANPRMTVDQIIARRAPKRDAKEQRKAAKAAKAEAGEDEDEDNSADELELEMMSDLEADLSAESEDDIERPEGAKADGTDEEEEEEEDSEDDEEEEKEPVEVDDGENWLKLGEKSSGEEESDEDDDEPAAAGGKFTNMVSVAIPELIVTLTRSRPRHRICRPCRRRRRGLRL